MKIAKKVKWENAGYGWLVIEDKNVGYKHCNGVMPNAYNVIRLLLTDKDVRNLINQYAHSERKKIYAIHSRVGMSGCEDFFIYFAEYFGGEIHVMGRKHIMHVSCDDKLNKDFMAYVGDFVEMVAYIRKKYKGFENLNRKKLRRSCGAKYILERRPEFERCNYWVTNLFSNEEE